MCFWSHSLHVCLLFEGLYASALFVLPANVREDARKSMSIEVSATNSDRRFRVLIEHSPDVITLLTPKGTVLYASPSVERVLGYTPQEFMSINGSAVIHPGDIDSLAHTFQQLLAIPRLVD